MFISTINQSFSKIKYLSYMKVNILQNCSKKIVELPKNHFIKCMSYVEKFAATTIYSKYPKIEPL